MLNRIGKIFVCGILAISGLSVTSFGAVLLMALKIPLDGNWKMWHIIITSSLAGCACFFSIIEIWRDDPITKKRANANLIDEKEL